MAAWVFGTKLLCGAATDEGNGIFANHLGQNFPFDLSYKKTLFFFGDIILVLNRDFKVKTGVMQNPTNYLQLPFHTVLSQKKIRNRYDHNNISIQGQRNKKEIFEKIFSKAHFWFSDNIGHAYYIPEKSRVHMHIKKKKSTHAGVYDHKTEGVFFQAYIEHSPSGIASSPFHYFILPLGKGIVKGFAEKHKQGKSHIKILKNINGKIVVQDKLSDSVGYVAFVKTQFKNGLLISTDAPIACLVRKISDKRIRLSVGKLLKEEKDFTLKIKGKWKVIEEPKQELDLLDRKYVKQLEDVKHFYKVKASSKTTKIEFFHNYQINRTLELERID